MKQMAWSLGFWGGSVARQGLLVPREFEFSVKMTL